MQVLPKKIGMQFFQDIEMYGQTLFLSGRYRNPLIPSKAKLRWLLNQTLKRLFIYLYLYRHCAGLQKLLSVIQEELM